MSGSDLGGSSGILNEVEAGRKVAEACRAHGISEGTYYRWKAKYGGMDVNIAEFCDVLEAWHDDYNWVRPHSALGQVPPAICAQRLAAEAGLL